MKFSELRLKNFGKFNNKVIKLEDGINLIYGENEAGKSTIHSFLNGMLFGIEKQRGRVSKEDTYTKYQPWDNPAMYEGSLDLVYQDKRYRIFRRFYKENKEYKVTDITTGRELSIESMRGISFIDGLTEENYRNTISVSQLKARTDKELAEEVRNHITNLSLSKSNQVNVTEAINFLTAKKKKIDSNQTYNKKLSLEEEVKKSEQVEGRMLQISAQIRQLVGQVKIEEANSSREELVKLDQYIEKYPGILEKYRIYLKLLEQKTKLSNSYHDYENNNIILLNDSKVDMKKDRDKPIFARYPFYLILSIIMIVWATFLKGTSGKNYLFMGMGIILIWGVYYVINRGHRKKETDLLLNNSTFEEQQRILKSIEELDLMIEEEAKVIIEYGTRICPFTQLDQNNMNALDKEVNDLTRNLKKKREMEQKKVAENHLELERLKWELEILEEETNFYEKKTALEELKEQLKEEKKEISAITLAIDTINHISANIHDDFGQKLNDMLSKWMREQTSGKYSEIKVDEKLTIKVACGDRFIDLEKLSIGTIEQVYLALRMSVNRLLFKEEKMPLLFDDTFALYDEKRLKATLEMLSRESDRQILIFTCHKREEELLHNLNISYNRIIVTE